MAFAVSTEYIPCLAEAGRGGGQHLRLLFLSGYMPSSPTAERPGGSIHLSLSRATEHKRKEVDNPIDTKPFLLYTNPGLVDVSHLAYLLPIMGLFLFV